MSRVSDTYPDVDPVLVETITTAVWSRHATRLAGGEVRFTCPMPEHEDRHPSARWNPHKGVWCCDACGAGGTALDLAKLLDLALSTETVYPIRDITGAVIALHVRVDRPGSPKVCYWRRPTGESGLDGTEVHTLPLYGTERLATAAAEQRVVVVEGEKCTDVLTGRGVLAIGTVTGSSAIPADTVLRILAGRDTILWPDADTVGRNHMARIAARLRVLSIPCRLVDPWPEKMTGEDAADFVGTDVELEALLAIATEPDAHVGTVGVLIADVVAERVQWLWAGRLALGKLAILEGRPDEGKTTVAADLAARTSTGRAMPFETTGCAPGGVVFLTAEDGLADTIRPRLEAAGADLTRIVAAKPEELPTLDDAGLTYIKALVERVNATLIIIDPLMAFVPDAVDTYRDHDSRRLLRKLSALAEETGAAVLVLRHVRKGAALNAKDAGGGSIGFTAAARIVLLAAGDPEDETRKVLARVKGNLSAPFPSLGYRLLQAGFTVKVDWIGPTAHTAEQLLAMPTTSEEASELDEAKAAILDLVVDGPIAAEQAMKELKRRGVAERTWKRAKIALRVRSRKEGFTGAWSWYPPEECQPPEAGHIDTWHSSEPSASTTAEKPLKHVEECQASEECQGDGHVSDGPLRDAGPAETPPAPRPRRTVRI